MTTPADEPRHTLPVLVVEGEPYVELRAFIASLRADVTHELEHGTRTALDVYVSALEQLADDLDVTLIAHHERTATPEESTP